MIEVDIPDTAESREWLRAYARDTLRERFRQKAIYLKFVGPIEHLIVRKTLKCLEQLTTVNPTPVARTRRSTSFAPMFGTGTSASTSGAPNSRRTIAFMAQQ